MTVINLRLCYTCLFPLIVNGPIAKVFSTHHHYHCRPCGKLFLLRLNFDEPQIDQAYLECVRLPHGAPDTFWSKLRTKV